jgi:signal peptide peptidase SppA
MAHKLPRLSKSLLDLPQLITAAKFEEIASLLEDRNDGIYEAASHAAKLLNDEESKYGSGDLVEGSVGVLRVEGPTTYKKTGWEAYCGGTSYQGLLEQMDEIVSSKDVKKVLMLVDSGGGEAYRAFQCARDLRKKADAAGVKIYAYVDGMAASAGYALASAAHEVIMNPDAECGSIGVVVRLVNQNKRLENEGITVKYITAGASKVPFADDGSYRPDYISDIQSKIDSLYTDFVDHVANMRSISADVVRGTDAKMFTSSDCLRLGLVDKVMEGEEFYTYLSETPETESNEEIVSPPKEDTVNIKPKSNNTQKDTKSMSAELQVDPTEFAKMQAQMEQQAALLAAYQAKETQLAKETLSAQLDNSPFLAECKEPLLNFFMSADVNDAHKELMNTVIGAANASNESVLADAVAQVTEAQSKVEAAEAEVESVKTEFATSVQSVQLEVKEQVQGSNVLAEKIAKLKAAQAK